MGLRVRRTQLKDKQNFNRDTFKHWPNLTTKLGNPRSSGGKLERKKLKTKAIQGDLEQLHE
eukprot:2451260-Amphidinium_carterae.1